MFFTSSILHFLSSPPPFYFLFLHYCNHSSISPSPAPLDLHHPQKIPFAFFPERERVSAARMGRWILWKISRSWNRVVFLLVVGYLEGFFPNRNNDETKIFVSLFILPMSFSTLLSSSSSLLFPRSLVSWPVLFFVEKYVFWIYSGSDVIGRWGRRGGCGSRGLPWLRDRVRALKISIWSRCFVFSLPFSIPIAFTAFNFPFRISAFFIYRFYRFSFRLDLSNFLGKGMFWKDSEKREKKEIIRIVLWDSTKISLPFFKISWFLQANSRQRIEWKTNTPLFYTLKFKEFLSGISSKIQVNSTKISIHVTNFLLDRNSWKRKWKWGTRGVEEIGCISSNLFF